MHNAVEIATPHLSRGVNIFYTVTSDGDQLKELDNPLNQITSEDVEIIKTAGLTHVRLALSPYPLMPDDIFSANTPVAKQYMMEVHQLITLFTNANIGVVLAVMPNEQSFEKLYKSPAQDEEWAKFFTYWGQAFSQYTPSLLAFETLNEPRFILFLAKDAKASPDIENHYPTDLLLKANARWIALENKLFSALRTHAPHHRLFATADGFSNAIALSLRSPSKFEGVTYSFHYYSPLLFTHQHADWFDFPGKTLKGLAYPAETENCKQILAVTTAETHDYVEHYCQNKWDITKHRQELETLRNWHKKHRVPVWMGEFGTFPYKAPPSSVNAYYHDVRQVAQEYGFGWCAWEYTNWLGRKLAL